MKISEINPVNNTVNIGNIKKILSQENKFISNLWNILHIQFNEQGKFLTLNSKFIESINWLTCINYYFCYIYLTEDQINHPSEERSK